MSNEEINQNRIKDEREAIKKHIIDNFQDKEFTTSDVFYSMNSSWNKKIFGKFFVALKEFTKEGFLQYKIGMRKSGKDPYPRKGAIYTIK